MINVLVPDPIYVYDDVSAKDYRKLHQANFACRKVKFEKDQFLVTKDRSGLFYGQRLSTLQLKFLRLRVVAVKHRNRLSRVVILVEDI